MKGHYVFYDASCPLCSNLRKLLTKIDWFKQINWIPVQKAEKDEQFWFLKGRNVYEEIYMLTRTGVVVSGYYAIRKVFSALPLTATLGWIMHLPLTDKIGTPFYMFVSRNRFDWFDQYENPDYD